MKIYYISRMGKTETLAKNVSSEAIKIEDFSLLVNEPFIILTYTDGNGVLPKGLKEFLDNNKAFLKGVVSTGSLARHAETYCFAADIISKDYNVPTILKVDGAGTNEDVEIIKEFLQ